MTYTTDLNGNMIATPGYTPELINDIQEAIQSGELEIVEVTKEYLDDLKMAAFLEQLYKD